ncbi:hypothetical protein COLO4_19529 [Corchorus olitorius]|uniref:Uncharacterized protein n=1 Tax=Corchorus olitorius TaxID=93759 RepID=A0A1R3J559_9ROSI|nr:hypothetical protein COLO4_19529 [Corchorus olitorius]
MAKGAYQDTTKVSGGKSEIPKPRLETGEFKLEALCFLWARCRSS